jgi:hypothetical protein
MEEEMSRFEDAPQQTIDFVENVLNQNFPELQGCLMKVMYDNKKRKSGGRFVLGKMKKTNDELKAFATDDNGNPYDYIMFLDRLVWDNIEEKDREKLVFHELCHCKPDFDSNTDQYKVQDHEIQTFYSEIEFCRDDPRWLERVSVIAESLYDPDADVEVPRVDEEVE